MLRSYFDKISAVTLPRGKEDPKISIQLDNLIKSYFAETLLFSDKIFINNHGPNINITALLRWLGWDLLEHLIYNNSIQFVHTPVTFTYLNKKVAKQFNSEPGFAPFKGQNLTFESFYDGTVQVLNEQTQLESEHIARLATLVEKNTMEVNSFQIYRDATAEINSQISEVDNLEDLKRENISAGFELTKAYTLMGLASVTDSNSIISKDKYDKIIKNKMVKLIDFENKVSGPFTTILEFENIPTIYELLTKNKLSFKEFVEIRESDEMKKFRQWIGDINANSEIDVIREYTKDIFYPIKSKVNSKSVRFFASSILSVLLSTINPIAGATTGISYNAFDSFLLDKLNQGWQPRYFVSNNFKKYA